MLIGDRNDDGLGHVEPSKTVYAAIGLSKKSWVVGVLRPDRAQLSIRRNRPLEDRRKRRRAVIVCYEAGYDGFWSARALIEAGVECLVLHPARLQVNRRAPRMKTNRIDVVALIRALAVLDRGDRNVCAMVSLLQSLGSL